MKFNAIIWKLNLSSKIGWYWVHIFKQTTVMIELVGLYEIKWKYLEVQAAKSDGIKFEYSSVQAAKSEDLQSKNSS